MNEVVPLYVPGNDITCAVAADAAGDRYLMGGRFVAVAGDLDGALRPGVQAGHVRQCGPLGVVCAKSCAGLPGIR